MDLLKEKISTQGNVLSNNILKVDSFLNHQIDVSLMQIIGKEFKSRFKNVPVDKVLTVESSGIAPAIFTAMEFGVNVVFARKQQSLTLNENILTADVISYTKNERTTINISKDYINSGDSILIIDDFLATGEVSKGLIEIIKNSGAFITGIGIVIEKSFQKGRIYLDNAGFHVESLVRIKSMDNGKVTYL